MCDDPRVTRSRPSVSLNALRAFEAVARHLSVSRASEALEVTHGAVSRQITGLEKQLGVELFTREKGGLQLSTAGRILFADVAPAFERLDTAVRNVQAHASPSTLLINVPPTFAMRWLIPRLASFQRRRPDVEIRLTTGKNPLADVLAGGFDLVVRRRTSASRKIDTVPFLSASLVPVCAPELLERRPIHEARDLQEHVLLHSNQQALEWPEWFTQAGLPGLKPRSELVFEEIYFALQAALDGMGVALVPSPLAADEIAAGRLVLPLYLARVGARDYHYYASPVSGSKALVEEFGQWLQNEGRESNRFAAELIAGLFPERAPAEMARAGSG
jgi:LysR family glycine cleavage system transcriptional activator